MIVTILLALSLAAQQPADTAVLDVPAVTPTVVQTSPQGEFTGLPRRAAPPRTMRDQWPVFALLAVGWVGIVAALLAFGRRSARLAGRVGTLLLLGLAGASPALAQSDPLPAPDFGRAYLHVFLAFGITWALLLGYVVLLHRRVAQAERDLERS